MDALKEFKYDEVLEAEDICNLEKEKKRLYQGIYKGEKLVVYGRRNTGKTSLVRNVIILEYRRKFPNAFILFCDLMGVKDLEAIESRLRASFEEAYMAALPARAWMENAARFLKGLRPSFSADSLTGEPSFTLELGRAGHQQSLQNIFSTLRKSISPRVPLLIVLDEFQDVSLIPEAEGILRNELQQFNKTPMIMMGSKKHLLAKMFSRPRAPFADFGSDIEFHDIPYDEYHEYIVERFKPGKLKISPEVTQIWQDLLFRSPESINIVGARILADNNDTQITEDIVRHAIVKVIEDRKSRLEELLASLNATEEEILITIARCSPVPKPTAKEFLRLVRPSHATVMKAVRKMEDHSFIEKTQLGYRLCNPLLHYYLLRSR